jgi:hypothetical protein
LAASLVAIATWLSRPSMVLSLKHDPEKCGAVFRKDHAQTIT